MLNVTAGYGWFSDLMHFFVNFHILLHVCNIITSSNFYKLCLNAKEYIEMKIHSNFRLKLICVIDPKHCIKRESPWYIVIVQ